MSPWIIGFTLFTFIPIIASLLFSFMDMTVTDDIFASPEFIGLENYQLLAEDNAVWAIGGGTIGSMWITIIFGAMSLPIGIIFPLVLALLVNSPNLKGKYAFRALFYMPFIVPFVAAVFLWGGDA
jgi:multiple sugar transport system permease protein